MDGCASGREAKAATRLHRMRERMQRMRAFDQQLRDGDDEGGSRGGPHTTHTHSLDLPRGISLLRPGCESALPVPTNSLLAFVQILHSLGIPVWTSDGENDEHLAALAVQMRSSGDDATPVIVDVLAQDSDFIVFEMDPAAAAAAAAGRRNTSVGIDPVVSAGGYAPLDSLRVDLTDDADDAPSDRGLSYRRYTSSAVSAALQLPPCMLPSLACLVGNDSNLALAHLHAHLRSPHFVRALAQARIPYAAPKAAATKGGGGGGGGGASVNGDANGGFANGTQLVDAVLACVHHLLKHASTLDMCTVATRLLGPETMVKAATEHGPLRAFRAAQRKYSLARFFRERRRMADHNTTDTRITRDYAIFDPGFSVDIEIEEKSAKRLRASDDAAIDLQPTPPVVDHDDTAFLLPAPLLAHYRSSHFSPLLLSIILTRQYQSHVALGDVLHPCAVHVQKQDGTCVIGCGNDADSHAPCLTVDECGRGVRRRIYEMLFHAIDARPVAITAVDTPRRGCQPRPSLSVRERIFVVPTCTTDDDARQRWFDVVVSPPQAATTTPTSSDAKKDEAAYPIPAAGGWSSLFGDAASSADGESGSDWRALFSLMDCAPDLGSFVAHRLPTASTRQAALAVALQPLIRIAPSLVSLALVMRNVLLHALRGVTHARFESAAIGCRLETHVQAAIDRAVIAVNAMAMQTALAYCEAHLPLSSSPPQPPPHPLPLPTPLLSFEAVSLSHLFADSYQWCTFALQTLRCCAHLHAASSATAVPASDSDSDATDPSPPSSAPLASLASVAPLPLVPLFECFSGATFHRLYARTLAAVEHKRVAKPTSAAPAKRGSAHARRLQSRRAASNTQAGSGETATQTAAPTRAQPLPTSTPQSSPSPPLVSLFSPSLCNSLRDLDAAVSPLCVRLLPDEVALRCGSFDMAAATRALFDRVRTAVWRSIGVEPIIDGVMEVDVQDQRDEEGNRLPHDERLLASADRADPAAVPAVPPRPALPYETILDVVRDADSTPTPHTPTPATTTSTGAFSLCCAADSLAPGIDDHPCACGWRPCDLLATVTADDGVAATDSQRQAEAGRGATAAAVAAKHKKGKKSGRNRK